MKKTIMLISLAGLFCGCALFGGGLTLSSDDQDYIRNAYDTPLDLTVSKAESDICWARAQEWIKKYSSKKIQTANDFMIQTYNPSGKEYAFGYYVTRKAAADTVQITVQCIVGNLYAKKDQDNNARILAHYIKTGKVVSKLIVKE
jgi:hypothetical protein